MQSLYHQYICGISSYVHMCVQTWSFLIYPYRFGLPLSVCTDVVCLCIYAYVQSVLVHMYGHGLSLSICMKNIIDADKHSNLLPSTNSLYSCRCKFCPHLCGCSLSLYVHINFVCHLSVHMDVVYPCPYIWKQHIRMFLSMRIKQTDTGRQARRQTFFDPPPSGWIG